LQKKWANTKGLSLIINGAA